MTNRPASLEPGDILGTKYRIERVLGSGGMGHVYEATNTVLRSKVAIKTLERQFGDQQVAVKRFLQEAQIAASIGHDNICEVIDVGDECLDGGDRYYYLVMPLLRGQSLGQWFDAFVPPTPAQVVDVLCQTLLGLQAAHEQEIVHRDIKPDNIFITDVGDRQNFVKILDFGVSKIVSSQDQLTRTGITMGTPLYMSPEQAKGARHVEFSADLFSVGVILYEAFVGALPYQGDNFNDVLVQIAQNPFPDPRAANPAVPPAIATVIRKACARAPVDRYPSAAAMVGALKKAFSGLENATSFPGVGSSTHASADAPTIAERDLAISLTPGSTKAAVDGAGLSPRKRLLVLLGWLTGIVGLGVLAYFLAKPVETQQPSTARQDEPVAQPPKSEKTVFAPAPEKSQEPALSPMPLSADSPSKMTDAPQKATPRPTAAKPRRPKKTDRRTPTTTDKSTTDEKPTAEPGGATPSTDRGNGRFIERDPSKIFD